MSKICSECKKAIAGYYWDSHGVLLCFPCHYEETHNEDGSEK